MKKNILCALVLTAYAMPVYASFTGNLVRAEYLYPDSSTVVPGGFVPAQTVVSAGAEFNSYGYTRVDISSTNILTSNILGSDVTFSPGSGSFNGHRFTDANGTVPDITNVTINPATNLPGFDASRVSFNTESVSINYAGLVMGPTHIVSLDVTFAPRAVPSTPQSVPTVSLLGLGVLGSIVGIIGFVSSRRRSRR